MNILHCHSEYSKDSTEKMEEICARAKEVGANSVCLTDHGTMMGFSEFIDACKAYELNPVPGIEAYLEDEKAHFILLPCDYEGFQAIAHATREASLPENCIGDYPITTDKILETYFLGNEHVVATTACIQGPVAKILLRNFYKKEKLKKQETEGALHKTAWLKYDAFEKQLEKVACEIKEAKRQKKEYEKTQTASYMRSLESLARKFERAEGFEKEALRKEYQEKKALRENAIFQITITEELLEELVKKSETLLQAQKPLQKEAMLYKKAVKAREELELEPEEDLLKEAEERLLALARIFPKLMVEVQYHGIEAEAYVMPKLVELARKHKLPIVASNDSHFARNTKANVEARRIVMFDYFKKSMSLRAGDEELYIKSEQELFEALCQVIDVDAAKEAIRNTLYFDKCVVTFPKEKHYPKIPLRDGKTAEVFFDELILRAKEEKRKQGNWNEEYEKRLQHEVEIIKSMGFIDYHLVVADYCNLIRLLGNVPREVIAEWNTKSYEDIPVERLPEIIKENGWETGVGLGPGRGSAVGSLVCYLLGITNIDPIKYDLLFERFLNPERVSMPDIDVDIATELRDFLIKCIEKKYGGEYVSCIATTGTLKAKNAVRFAGRERASQYVLEGNQALSESEFKNRYVEQLASSVPADATLLDCESSETIKKLLEEEECRTIWEHAKLIEGAINQTGVHAGGVIISDETPLCDIVPTVWNSSRNVFCVSADMAHAEALGLLKMDVLGLNTLDIINEAIHLIKKHHGISIDTDRIPFEEEVFASVFATGQTNSIFQFENEGMKSMLRQYKPTCFEDLIFLVALYRPGPLQYLERILAIRNGKASVSFKTKELEPILKQTYGVAIYQEQVMALFQKLAGFSLGSADLVRRAMSKKKLEKLKIERKAFIYGDPSRGIDGCVMRGIKEEIANEIFDEMMEFAKYAFNKSHSAAYALLSYQTAYLKFHYPAEFLASVFNHKEQKKFLPILSDAKAYHTKLLPVDINRSEYGFSVEKQGIRFGFSGITGISSKETIDVILSERKKAPFSGFQDFLKRTIVTKETEKGCKYGTLPKELVKKLCLCGAFDRFGYPRRDLENLPSLSDKKSREALEKEIDALELTTGPQDKQFNMAMEIEYCGSILSFDPLEHYPSERSLSCKPIEELLQLSKDEKEDCTILGFIAGCEKKMSKKGNAMFHLTIQGKTGTLRGIMMSYTAKGATEADFLGKVFLLTGQCDNTSIFVKTYRSFELQQERFYLAIETKEVYEKIARVFDRNNKEGKCVIVCTDFTNRGGEIHKMRRSVTQELYLKNEDFNKLRKEGVIFQRSE